MTTRRELLKLASALGMAGTIPTLEDRSSAALALETGKDGPRMTHPATFAYDTFLDLSSSGDQFSTDLWGVICPEENAEYSMAREKLEASLQKAGIDSLRDVGDYDGAATSLFIAMYDAGLRHGAAYENLRRSIVGELITCEACWGTGMAKGEDYRRVPGTTCAVCGGAGTVAMKG